MHLNLGMRSSILLSLVSNFRVMFYFQLSPWKTAMIVQERKNPSTLVSFFVVELSRKLVAPMGIFHQED